MEIKDSLFFLSQHLICDTSMWLIWKAVENMEARGRLHILITGARAHKHAWRSELPQLFWFTRSNQFLAKSILSEAGALS